MTIWCLIYTYILHTSVNTLIVVRVTIKPLCLCQSNELSQLCVNLCAETLQHFYNTHVFKAAEEACIEEGVQCDMDVQYFENAPIVELISSQVSAAYHWVHNGRSLWTGLTWFFF